MLSVVHAAALLAAPTGGAGSGAVCSGAEDAIVASSQSWTPQSGCLPCELIGTRIQCNSCSDA